MTDAEAAEVERVLASTEGEANVPTKLPGTPGPTTHVPPAEQSERRALMSHALANGLPMHEIVTAFDDRFGMSAAAVNHLRSEIRAMWTEDDTEESRYTKHAAKRRLRSHIREASKDRKWTAVGNLESVLSGIEGTSKDEDEQPVDINARLSEAVLHLLGQEDTKGVRIMIERERAIIELGQRDGTTTILPAKIIDAAG